MGADCAVIVFARAPVPGAAKTRLAPKLGAWRAARLQLRLTERALRTAAGGGKAALHVTPRRNHASFQDLRKRFGVPVALQQGHDLGERMHNALERALRRHRTAIVIGTDCPALNPRDLQKAARLLHGNCDVVLSPAEDGGYVLVGLKKPCPRLFKGVEWGSAAVLRQTLERSAGLRVRLLRTLWDVDRPEDLARLRSLRFS